MARKATNEILDAWDHPIVFTLLIAMTTVFWLAIATWVFKAVNIPGAAAAVQHP